MSCLASKARLHHDSIRQQRLRGLNNCLIDLSTIAADALCYIYHNNNSSHTTKKMKEYIDSIINDISSKAIGVKQDIKVIANCNYQWLSIQPMVTETDMDTYFLFMEASYLNTVRDMVALCDEIETIKQLLSNKLKELKMENDSVTRCWTRRILNYLYEWLPWKSN